MKQQLIKKICFAIGLVQILILVWSKTAFADSPHDLDTTFNNTGIVTSTTFSMGNALVVQPDRKIIVGGSSGSSALARYDSVGKLDSNFGNMGVVNIPISGFVQSAAIQPNDGKIVSVISNLDKGKYYLTRHTINGTLDKSFNTTGIITLPVKTVSEVAADIAIQPSANKIVVVVGTGTNDETVILRYDNNGNLDPTFNGTGLITNTLGLIPHGTPCLLVDANEKIVVTGHVIGMINSGNGCCFIARYNDNGLDTSFNGTGVVTNTLHGGNSIAIQADGKIVSTGSFFPDPEDNPDFSVVRYNIDGSPDTSFNNNTGIARVDINGGVGRGTSVAIQSDGKIVVGGYFKNSITNSYSLVVVRFEENGELDTSWNDIGYVMMPIAGEVYGPTIEIQSDGKILIADNQYMVAYEGKLIMARYVGDPSFSAFYLPVILK